MQNEVAAEIPNGVIAEVETTLRLLLFMLVLLLLLGETLSLIGNLSH